MPNGAIIFTWSAPRRDREQHALEALRTSFARYMEIVESTRPVQSARVFFNDTGSTFPWAGIMIIEGELDELRRLHEEEDFRRNLRRAPLHVEDFTMVTCVGGSHEDLQEPISHYEEHLATLGEPTR